MVFCLECKGTAAGNRPEKHAGDCLGVLSRKHRRKANESPAREARRDFPGVLSWEYKGNANENAAREARRWGGIRDVSWEDTKEALMETGARSAPKGFPGVWLGMQR